MRFILPLQGAQCAKPTVYLISFCTGLPCLAKQLISSAKMGYTCLYFCTSELMKTALYSDLVSADLLLLYKSKASCI